MSEHITNQEWIEYLSCTEFGEEQLKLFARVHAHIGACAECRALHAASTRSMDTLRAYAPVSVSAIPSAYRAVAAQPATDEDAEDIGSMIAVPFEVTADGARFKASQLMLTGEAERFVFVAAADNKRLTDDFDDATYIELAADGLIISLPDTDCVLSASISGADGSTDLPAFDADGKLTAPLPVPGRYLLNITMNTR